MTEVEQRKIFSENLTNLLQRCGKTQLQLANSLDVSKSTVSSWCSGSKMPRMGKIDEIADWLSVSRSELIEEGGGKDGNAQPANRSAQYLTDDEQKLLDGYRLAPPPIQQAVDGLLAPYVEKSGKSAQSAG